MEIIMFLLILLWLSYHPIYILYGVIASIAIGVMWAYTPRLLKAIGIGLPAGWIVYLAVEIKKFPVEPTQIQTIACYVGTILVLWLLQVLADLPEIREELRMRKEVKRIRQQEVHPMPVGFVPDNPSNQKPARSKPVPIGFQPPGDKEGSSNVWSQKRS